MRERRKSAEVNNEHKKSYGELSVDSISTVDQEAFSDIVKPLLPGPVDMRTYKSVEKQQPTPPVPTSSPTRTNDPNTFLDTFNNGTYFLATLTIFFL